LITPKILREEYRSLSSSLCSFSPLTCYLTLLGPNILLITLLSKTLSLQSFHSVRDQVPNPYKTTAKIIVLYIITLIFGWQTGRQKILC